MTLDEKLELFYKSAIEDATQQSIILIEEYKKNLEQIRNEHKTKEIKKSEEKLRIQSGEMIHQKNKYISAENLLLKKNITEKAIVWQNAVFDKVKEKLQDFMKTPEYRQLLKVQIQSGIDYAKANELIIYINKSDKDKQHLLTEFFHHEIMISTENFIGGTRIIIPKRNLLIDNSFFTKLAEEKDSFVLKINRQEDTPTCS